MRRTKLHKQIKKRLLTAPVELFISCAIGFEPELCQEIAAIIPEAEDLRVEDGGIRLMAPVTAIPAANRKLRTATRILMRICRFSATDFSQMERALAAVPWPVYLTTGSAPMIRVTAKKSKLYHGTAIAGRVETAITQSLSSPMAVAGDATLPAPAIFVRGVRDRFTLSVDSTGPLLHMRGMKAQGGVAPIRETLAAACLMVAGYDPALPLRDPMCGTGTFSMEAALISRKADPGCARSFAWENWPVFRHHPHPDPDHPPSFLSAPILASDRDPATIAALLATLQEKPVLRGISASQEDFFAIRPEGPAGLVALNPPYGLRIGEEHQARQMMQTIWLRLKTHWSGWQVLITIPETLAAKGLPFPLSRRAFRHGGLSMALLYGRVP